VGYARACAGVRLPQGLCSADEQGINGNKMEKACDLVHITLNKNAVVGDVSALAPGGVRIGAPAMTSRGLKESDFETIADLLDEVNPQLHCLPQRPSLSVPAGHCGCLQTPCVRRSSDLVKSSLQSLLEDVHERLSHAMCWGCMHRCWQSSKTCRARAASSTRTGSSTLTPPLHKQLPLPKLMLRGPPPTIGGA
jgi:hypothetical protein